MSQLFFSAGVFYLGLYWRRCYEWEWEHRGVLTSPGAADCCHILT